MHGKFATAMHINFKFFFHSLFLLLLLNCASKPTLDITLTGTTAFDDANVADIVFTFENIIVDGEFLDQDNNGQPDIFVYPSECGASKPANCGFDAESGVITVGELPEGFQYTVLVQLRSSTATVLYDGQINFTNTNGQKITVPVN